MSNSAGFRPTLTNFRFFHMLENLTVWSGALETSWNVDSDRVIGRNFPLKNHEVRDAYFRLLALTKDTRFCKAMM